MSKSAAAAGAEPVLDPSALDAIRSIGQPGLLAKVIALYRSETPKQLAQLREAAAAGDGPLLFRAAHTMKSSSRNLGGTRLGAICASCEAQAKAGQVAEATALVAVIEREFAALDAALAACGGAGAAG